MVAFFEPEKVHGQGYEIVSCQEYQLHMAFPRDLAEKYARSTIDVVNGNINFVDGGL